MIEIIKLIVTFDREVYSIAGFSIAVSLISLIISVFISVILVLFIRRYKSLTRIFSFISSSLIAMPTVVVGLSVYSLISRSGPFGFTGLLFTPGAIIIGQVVLCVPIISTTLLSGISVIPKEFYETLKTFNIGRIRSLVLLFLELREIFISSMLTGFGRIFGEVGVSMMLGGNIRYYTRTITTAIALETGKGELHFAFALGVILLTISLFVNWVSRGIGGKL